MSGINNYFFNLKYHLGSSSPKSRVEHEIIPEDNTIPAEPEEVLTEDNSETISWLAVNHKDLLSMNNITIEYLNGDDNSQAQAEGSENDNSQNDAEGNGNNENTPIQSAPAVEPQGSVGTGTWSGEEIQNEGIDLNAYGEYFIGVYDNFYRFNPDTIMRDFPGKSIQNLSDLKEAINELNQAIEEQKRTERREYAYSRIVELKTVLGSYDSEYQNIFENVTNQTAEQYINGNITQNEFDSQIITKLNEVITEAEAAISQAKEQRRAYAESRVEFYRAQLAEYGEEFQTEFVNQAQTLVEECVNGSHADEARDKFDADLNNLYKNIKYKAENPPILNEDEINSVVNMIRDVIPDITSEQVSEMADAITQMAKTRGVDPADYVSARLADFLVMKSENPDMTLEEMNEALAIENLSNMMFDNINTIYSDVFGFTTTDLEDLVSTQELALFDCDYDPALREAYFNTRTIVYMMYAATDDMSNYDYYEAISNDLLNLYPQSFEMSDEEKEQLIYDIQALSPQQIIDFSRKAIALPSIEDENYEQAYNTFIQEFNCAISTSEYDLSQLNDNPMSINELYLSRMEVEFNADEIIDATNKMDILNEAVVQVMMYNTVQNIQNEVNNGDLDKESALWQIGVLYTGSTDENVVLEFLKNITGFGNLSIENNKVILAESDNDNDTAFARGQNRILGISLLDNIYDSVVDWCKDKYESAVSFVSPVTDTIEEVCTDIQNFVTDPNTWTTFGKYCGYATIGLGIGAVVFSAPVVASCALVMGLVSAGSSELGSILRFAQNGDYSTDAWKELGYDTAMNGMNAMMDVWGIQAQTMTSSLNTLYANYVRNCAKMQKNVNNVEYLAGGTKNGIFSKISQIFSNKSSSSSNKLFGYEATKMGDASHVGSKSSSPFMRAIPGRGELLITDADTKLNLAISAIKHETKSLSEVRKMDYLYDFITNKIGTSRGYKQSILDSQNFPQCDNLLSDLLYTDLGLKSVCRHRSILFNRMARMLGSEVYTITGSYCGTPHAFNVVKTASGEWRMYDLMLGAKNIPCDEMVSGLLNQATIHASTAATATRLSASKIPAISSAIIAALCIPTLLNAQPADSITPPQSGENIYREQLENYINQLRNGNMGAPGSDYSNLPDPSQLSDAELAQLLQHVLNSISNTKDSHNNTSGNNNGNSSSGNDYNQDNWWNSGDYSWNNGNIWEGDWDLGSLFNITSNYDGTFNVSNTPVVDVQHYYSSGSTELSFDEVSAFVNLPGADGYMFNLDDIIRSIKQEYSERLVNNFSNVFGVTPTFMLDVTYDEHTGKFNVHYTVDIYDISVDGHGNSNGGTTSGNSNSGSDDLGSNDNMYDWFNVIAWDDSSMLASLDGGGSSGLVSMDDNNFCGINVSGYALDLYKLAVELLKAGYCKSMEEACNKVKEILVTIDHEPDEPEEYNAEIIREITPKILEALSTNNQDMFFNGYILPNGGGDALESYAQSLMKTGMYATIEDARNAISDYLGFTQGAQMCFDASYFFELITELSGDDLLGIHGLEKRIIIVLGQAKDYREQGNKELYLQYMNEAEKNMEIVNRYYILEEIQSKLAEIFGYSQAEWAGDENLGINVPEYITNSVYDYLYNQLQQDYDDGYNEMQIMYRWQDRMNDILQLSDRINSCNNFDEAQDAINAFTNSQNNTNTYSWLNTDNTIESFVYTDACSNQTRYRQNQTVSYIDSLKWQINCMREDIRNDGSRHTDGFINDWFYGQNPNIEYLNERIAELEAEIARIEYIVEGYKLNYYNALLYYGKDSAEAISAKNQYENILYYYYSSESSGAQETTTFYYA